MLSISQGNITHFIQLVEGSSGIIQARLSVHAHSLYMCCLIVGLVVLNEHGIRSMPWARLLSLLDCLGSWHSGQKRSRKRHTLLNGRQAKFTQQRRLVPAWRRVAAVLGGASRTESSLHAGFEERVSI